MLPLAQLSLDLPDTVSTREVVNHLDEKYNLNDFSSQTTDVTFFDSFDWRLYEKNRLCYLQDKTLYLTDFSDRQQVPPLPLVGWPHRFWWQFPQSDMKQALAGILDMRALLPHTPFSQATRELRVTNSDEKVVAIVLLMELDLGSGKDIRSVRLCEVRGYNKWFLKLSRDMSGFGETRPDTRVQTLKAAMAAVGRVPMDYSSGFSVPLTPDMESLTAVKTIYQDLLTTMQDNEQGIIDDLDSEFLHDFRVAIRRTRSGLTLIKDVLGPDISNRFKDDFRYLGRITGPVRDLDVYLLMEDNYKARLPEYLQEGLHYFFEDLAKKRDQELKKLVRALGEPRYRSITSDWQEFLSREDNELQEKNSQVAIGTLARKIITKRFLRILRDGKAIFPGSPDDELHRLRIQGKKLRYSLEFFSSLFPKQEMKKLIKQLKMLQNNLGDFNDLSIQQEMLEQYLAAIKPGTVKSKKLSAAIGGLLTNLYHEHRRVRTQFEETFTQFATKKNMALYHNLFG
jgi:CHAD domain-containing protein